MATFIIWLVCAITTIAIGNTKYRKGLGWALGIFLGPIGLIIIIIIPAQDGGENRKCPYCAEIIKSDAKICRYCGKEVEPIRKYGQIRPML